jgi:hypothetical protein
MLALAIGKVRTYHPAGVTEPNTASRVEPQVPQVCEPHVARQTERRRISVRAGLLEHAQQVQPITDNRNRPVQVVGVHLGR